MFATPANQRTVTIKVTRWQALKMAMLATMMASAPHQFESSKAEWTAIHDRITDSVRELDQKIEKSKTAR